MSTAEWKKAQLAAALVIGIFISSPMAIAASAATQNASASGKVGNTMAAKATPYSIAGVTGSNITFGNQQFIGTEYDKTISVKPTIINGTPASQIVFRGNGLLNGLNVTDNGKGFFISGSHGWMYSQGNGVWLARNGSNGMATYTFQGIEHYGPDGKLRGTIFDTVKATGKLAFLDNTAIIDKHQVDKAGNIITKFWELK